MESENYTKKIVLFEQSHKKLLDHCNTLEKTLLLVNQGVKNLRGQKENGEIEIQDIQTSDEINSNKGNTTQ